MLKIKIVSFSRPQSSITLFFAPTGTENRKQNAKSCHGYKVQGKWNQGNESFNELSSNVELDVGPM